MKKSYFILMIPTMFHHSKVSLPTAIWEVLRINERFENLKTLEHNIIQIHNSVLWYWKYSTVCCQSHKTLLCIWIMLCRNFVEIHTVIVSILRIFFQDRHSDANKGPSKTLMILSTWKGANIGCVCYRPVYFNLKYFKLLTISCTY